MNNGVDALVFTPCGDQLVIAHGHSIRIVAAISGVIMLEVPIIATGHVIKSLSWSFNGAKQ